MIIIGTKNLKMDQILALDFQLSANMPFNK